MSAFSLWHVQKAMYAALTGDATLMALVTGVHDRVPAGAAFPYITIGEVSGTDWSHKTGAGQRVSVTLHAFSRQGGRKEAASILDRVHALLHDANLSVEGQHAVMIRYDGGEITLETDGLTYRGSARFTVLTEV